METEKYVPCYTESAGLYGTVLGGMRALDASAGESKHGVFTNRPQALTDFFVNLLDMSTDWRPCDRRTSAHEALTMTEDDVRDALREVPDPRSS